MIMINRADEKLISTHQRNAMHVFTASDYVTFLNCSLQIQLLFINKKNAIELSCCCREPCQ